MTDSPVSLMTSGGYPERRRRLLYLLSAQDLDAVVLRRRANLSPYSGGGRFHIVATPEAATASRSQLPDRLLRRVRHVVTENRSVLDAASALRQNDSTDSGNFLTESQASDRPKDLWRSKGGRAQTRTYR